MDIYPQIIGYSELERVTHQPRASQRWIGLVVELISDNGCDRHTPGDRHTPQSTQGE